MTPLIDIGLEATAILTIMCGIVGLLVSLGLLFWPDRIRRINASLNRHYRLKEHLAYFDKTIPNALFVYRHPMVYGALLTIGAVVTLAFLFFQLDIDRIVAILTAPGVRRLLWQMAFEVMVLSGKVAGVLGLLLGLFLMVAPDRLRRIENRLNTWIGTQAATH